VTPEGLAHIQEMVDLAQEQHTLQRGMRVMRTRLREPKGTFATGMARQATAQVPQPSSPKDGRTKNRVPI